MNTTELDAIKAAITDDRLLQRATLDCIEALARFAIDGRSPREAIALLSHWQQTFERFERSRRP
jgi:hypothetical protein